MTIADGQSITDVIGRFGKFSTLCQGREIAFLSAHVIDRFSLEVPAAGKHQLKVT